MKFLISALKTHLNRALKKGLLLPYFISTKSEGLKYRLSLSLSLFKYLFLRERESEREREHVHASWGGAERGR